MTSRRPRTIATEAARTVGAAQGVRPARRASLRRIVLLSGVLLACAGAGGAAMAAQVAGVVVNLSGPLMDRKADGTVKVLGVKSEIESGDTLVTEKNTYARIRFIDNGEITLRPDTAFKVEDFAYESDKPEADSASFSLIKGGLRSITGLLGKRNKEKFQLKTPTATIGIRGTTFIVQLVEPPLNGMSIPLPSQPAPQPPGLYVTVTDGAIMVTNPGGAQGFQAGQFGFVSGATQAPVIVPGNPAIKFAPPPAFNAPTGPAGADAQKTPAVECTVR